MRDFSFVDIVLACAIVAMGIGCSDESTESIVGPESPLGTYYGFFPGIQLGDTISWIYSVDKNGSTNTRQVSGTMSWLVTSIDVVGRDTTTQVLQMFSGTGTNWRYSTLLDTISAGTDTTKLTILTKADGSIRFSGSAYPEKWWYYPPYYTFSQYDTTGTHPSIFSTSWVYMPLIATALVSPNVGLEKFIFSNGAISEKWTVKYVRR